ncbi:MAG: hypothetical protein RLZ44_1361 [Pseudomonadota bacterium]
MPIEARRAFRLALTVALALAGGYALRLPLPYLAPLFAFFLAAAPAPPMGPKALLGLVLVLLATLGVGLLLVPLLQHYAFAAVLIVALGLYFSNDLALRRGQALVGTLLTVGLTMISAAGQASFEVAAVVIQALVIGIVLAIVCHWLVYPWFPEDATPARPKQPAGGGQANASWLAVRATLIVLPAYLAALANPAAYMPLIMKSVSLARQDSVSSARHAGRELLGSTFLGGCCAVLFWFGLKLCPSLWLFFLWMALFGLYFAAKRYGVFGSRFSPSFWQNTAVTMLIMLGPAVEDSANGKDVYQAFAVRMALFVAVTLYAWLAIHLLEQWRSRRFGGAALTAVPEHA